MIWKILLVVLSLLWVLPANASFTWPANTVAATGAGGSTSASATITRSASCTQHCVFIAGFVQSITAGTWTSETCSDNHSHTYTFSPQSPYGPVQTAADQFVAGYSYWIDPPSGSSTITCSSTGVTNSLFAGTYVTEVDSNLPIYFDTTATGTGGHADALKTWPSTGLGATCLGAGCLTSSPATLPSITVPAGDLLFAQFTTDQGNQSTAGGSWTHDTTTSEDYYILSSSSGATAANFADDCLANSTCTSDAAGAIIVAFTNTAPGAEGFGKRRKLCKMDDAYCL